jgi:hypothetical protein
MVGLLRPYGQLLMLIVWALGPVTNDILVSYIGEAIIKMGIISLKMKLFISLMMKPSLLDKVAMIVSESE